MSKVRLQVQVDEEIMNAVKDELDSTGIITFSVQDLVQVLLAKVAREGINIDVEFLSKDKKSD